MDDQIRKILSEHARLPIDMSDLRDEADLYQAGMTSHASVNVMLALEDTFDIEFPDYLLRKSTFESIGAIRAAIYDLSTVGAQQTAGAQQPT
jgi:acyl carrier protein